MHKVFSLMIAAVALSFAGCASHAAYGPDGDERLDDSISASKGTGTTDAAAIMAIHCKDQEKQLAAAGVEVNETKKVKMLTDAYLAAKEKYTKLDEAASSQTDLLYGKEGDGIKANLANCRDLTASAYSAADRFIRELVDMPVVQEMQNRKMVDVPRVDFSILKKAIDRLNASDREVLLNKVNAVESAIAAK